jgi:hypothetical protein
MDVTAPHDKLQLLLQAGQSKTVGTYPMYDPNRDKIGLGALGISIEGPVKEVREQHKTKVAIEVLKLDRKAIQLPTAAEHAGPGRCSHAQHCHRCSPGAV